MVRQPRRRQSSKKEHQKLAGTLALLWGDANFERPPVPFESFLTGIGLHDRAYGPLDNLPIEEYPAVLEPVLVAYQLTRVAH